MHSLESRKILILYGSQTGTAQDIAERIWREGKRINLHGPIKCMDDYPVENLINEPIVVFVCSTTGQGEEPDNMKKFWRFLLRKSLPSNSLHRVKYAVLGLGDSSYVKFNFAAKKLSRRLASLGGTAIIDTGLGDDQHDLGPDAVIDPWIQKLWASIGQMYNIAVDNIKPEIIPSTRWNVEKINEKNVVKKDNFTGLNEDCKYSQRNPCRLTLISNVRTTSESHFQDVRLLKFSTPKNLSYQPGDVLMLVPQNSCDKANKLFTILNENREPGKHFLPEDVVQITVKDTDMPVPDALKSPIKLWDCAKKFWDLNAVPRRYVFSILSHLTTNELEKEKLEEFSQTQGQEELYNYCNRPKRNILEVLSDFPYATQNLTLEFLFEIFQPIRPRAFSIASSPTVHENQIHVLLAVVEFKTKLVEKRLGLCSTYLASLTPESTVFGWVRRGSFKFPPSETPIIMVGPGTGVAPFRSYINEQNALNKASDEFLLLFFGCRHENADFHCKYEWETLQKNKSLKLFCAFSRDQPEKIYVQHVISQQGKIVWEMLSTFKAYIFVAGSSKNMPQSVRESFVNAVKIHGGFTESEAENFIVNMEKTGKYQTETWG